MQNILLEDDRQMAFEMFVHAAHAPMPYIHTQTHQQAQSVNEHNFARTPTTEPKRMGQKRADHCDMAH